jgi:putative spermidine/putrescine transport system substrate-binding protein
MVFKKHILGMATAVLFSAAAPYSAIAAEAICYNCPPQWADWAAQLAAIKENLGIDVPHDNKNSGQTLSQLIAEKDNPVADVAYYGVSFGIAAKEQGVTAAYKPKHFDEIPEGLKDADGHWFTIHSGALGLFVNVDALSGKPVPMSWKDLLKRDAARPPRCG